MPGRERKYAVIDDFSPGIYSTFGFGEGVSTVSGPAPAAPLGAAQMAGTFRCQPLAGGGLGPLPKRQTARNLPQPESPTSLMRRQPQISGMWANGPVSDNIANWAPGIVPSDDVIVVYDYLLKGASLALDRRKYQVYLYKAYQSVPTSVNIFSSTGTVTPLQFVYWGCSACTSRINTVDPMLPGYPVNIWEWAESEINVVGRQGYFGMMFPNPAAPTVDLPGSLTGTSGRYGQIISHQNRVLMLEQQYYARGASGFYMAPPFNEDVSFTDPPNSELMGSQDYIFVQEAPTGYGAWGSINAGELFLVKNHGGGVIVSGDINNPQVTRLPGVMSTGGLISQAASTAIGLVYCTASSGAFVWSGSSTSQRISAQLDPSFFYRNSDRTEDGICFGVETVITEWFDYIIFPNNWLYNIASQSWWRLEDPSIVSLWRTSRGFGDLLWGTPQVLPDGVNNAALQSFDKNDPATSYSWQSHPIPATMVEMVEVDEVTLMAQGAGTVVITLTGKGGGTKTVTFTLDAGSDITQPKRFLANVGVVGYNIIVKIESNGAGGLFPAPVVYSIALGYTAGNLTIPT